MRRSPNRWSKEQKQIAVIKYRDQPRPCPNGYRKRSHEEGYRRIADGDQIRPSRHVYLCGQRSSGHRVAGLRTLDHSGPTRHEVGWGFLWSSTWDPVTEEFGALPFIYGTVVTSFIALLISVPLGVGAAIFLSELAPAKLSNA